MRHRFLTWLETKAIHKSDAIISVGNRLKDWALEELGNSGKEKVFVIPNGVDTRLFDVKNHAKSLRKELGLANEDFIILHAKQLVENNGQRFLIESITDISRVVPKVKLVLAGDGPLMEALGELTHTLGVSDRVVFTGDIPNPVVADYLAVSDVVVVPSIRLKGAEEASGIFLVEAMAMGRPVVASNIGGLAETITHDVNGILVPEKDSDAIARNVIRLHDNPSFARTLGSNARRYAEEQRSWTQAARATLQVYEWCLRAAGAEQDRVIESVG